MNIELFKNPTTEYKPIYTIDWNDRIEKAGIDRLLLSLKRIDAGGFYVRPLAKQFRPNQMRTYLEPEYLTDEFFELIEYTMQRARELGLLMLMYDEAGWPSGYANGAVTRQNAAFGRSHLGSPAHPTLTDPLNREATEAFINSTYIPYFSRINSFYAAFTDEPSAGDLPWPREFDSMFDDAEKAALSDAAREDEFALKTRIRYRRLCGEMFLNNWFKAVHEVCRRHGVPLTGHLDADHITLGAPSRGYGNPLPLLRELDIPGVDVIWRQIDLTHPNDCGNYFWPRFASSAQAQTGGKRVLSESFAIYGASLTGDEMRYTINAQLSRGVNLFNFMGVPYSTRRMLALSMRPAFIAEMPGFEALSPINGFTARACALMSMGKRAASTALYLPVDDILAGGSCAEKAAADFDRLGLYLEESGVDFDITDDEFAHTYESLIVPENRFCRLKAGGNIGAGLKTDSCELVHYTRVLDSGEQIYYVFNRASKAITAEFETGFDYVLDPETGFVTRFASRTQSFLPGQARAYLISGESYPEDKPLYGRSLQAGGFKQISATRLFIDESGVHSENVPSAEFDGEFSGEIAYAARITLPETPSDGCMIDLGRVECSARVFINGTYAGSAAFHPMRVYVPRELVAAREFELEIRVSNTAGNAVAAAKLESIFPQYEIGSYHSAHTLEFELHSPRGGMYGPVKIHY